MLEDLGVARSSLMSNTCNYGISDFQTFEEIKKTHPDYVGKLSKYIRAKLRCSTEKIKFSEYDLPRRNESVRWLYQFLKRIFVRPVIMKEPYVSEPYAITTLPAEKQVPNKLVVQVPKLEVKATSSHLYNLCRKSTDVLSFDIFFNTKKKIFEFRDPTDFRSERNSIRFGTSVLVVTDRESLYQWLRDLTREGVEPNPGPRGRRGNAIIPRKQPKTIRRRPPQQLNKRPATASFFPASTSNVTNQSVQRNTANVVLDYEELITDYNNAGGPIVAGEYRVGNIIDIDPLILSRAIQFVAYMFDIYQEAIVTKVYVEYVWDNLEQHALDVAVFAGFQPLLSSMGSRGSIESLLAGGLCIYHNTMSEQYGKKSQVMCRRRLNPANILGNPIHYRSNPQYSNTSSSGASNPLYVSWAVFSSLATIPAGFSFRARIKLQVKFFNKRPIISSLYYKSEDGTEYRSVIKIPADNGPGYVAKFIVKIKGRYLAIPTIAREFNYNN